MPTPDRSRPSRSARRGEAPVRPTFKENVWYWVKAIVAILIVRAFIAEPYRIPSESMEDTLLVGDFLIVSKLHWGPRTPETVGIPVTGIYLPGLRFPQVRLPGFAEPERGDVVVFNYPASVDVERGVIPASVPIERRAPYIKRIMALPGFGKQKAQIFVALLAKQLDVRPEGWESAVGDYALEGHRSVADVVDEGSLQKVRDFKKQKKAAAKAGS